MVAAPYMLCVLKCPQEREPVSARKAMLAMGRSAGKLIFVLKAAGIATPTQSVLKQAQGRLPVTVFLVTVGMV